MGCKELDALVWMTLEHIAKRDLVAVEGSRLVKPEYSDAKQGVLLSKLIQDVALAAVKRDKELRKGKKRIRPVW